MKTCDLFDLKYTEAGSLLERFDKPWEAVTYIADFIMSIIEVLPKDIYKEIKRGVWVARSARIADSASVSAPCIIGEDTEVRHCAFIRGSVLVGKGCVIGNSCEIKNSILFDSVHVPHFNYVGDSILGYSAHLGAGALTSNVKSDRSDICVTDGDLRVNTKRYKLGAIIGDNTEIGCGAVLCPGSIIGKNCIVYPQTTVRGTVQSGSIYKSIDNVIMKV